MTQEEIIHPENLPKRFHQNFHLLFSINSDNKTLKEIKQQVERDYILAQLERNNWNVSQTAKVLNIERTNLHKKIHFYKLK